jgi:hypothetical protein
MLRHVSFTTKARGASFSPRALPTRRTISCIDSPCPGCSILGAEKLMAEIGADMAQFPASSHLASWGGICPGNNRSGGKARSGRIRKGSRWLRQTSPSARARRATPRRHTSPPAAAASPKKWIRADTPEYQTMLRDFLYANKSLTLAAREKNLDAATVAYLQLTLSCVNCHKVVRGPRK